MQPSARPLGPCRVSSQPRHYTVPRAIPTFLANLRPISAPELVYSSLASWHKPAGSN